MIHPDGTIFAVQWDQCPDFWANTSVIGIDPTTGRLKFSVQLGSSEWPGDGGATTAIIAGDGYAYVPYTYLDGPDLGPWTTHLLLLRIDSIGAYDRIQIKDIDYRIGFGAVNIITNADQGTVVTWSEGLGADTKSGMAITTGASASPVSGPQVAGQTTAVLPVLQTEDGSFVGSVGTGDDPSDDPDPPNMVAFDASGAVRWMVPNEHPEIATADGGVIGRSGITYDRNGNATGRLGSTIQSWTENAYQIGSVDQIVSAMADVAFELQRVCLR